MPSVPPDQEVFYSNLRDEAQAVFYSKGMIETLRVNTPFHEASRPGVIYPSIAHELSSDSGITWGSLKPLPIRCSCGNIYQPGEPGYAEASRGDCASARVAQAGVVERLEQKKIEGLLERNRTQMAYSGDEFFEARAA